VTLFAQAGVELPASDWWLAVVGEPPESKTERLRESLQTMEGHLGKAKLILNVLASRVDWIVGFDPNLDQELNESPNVGPYPDVLESFGGKIFPWLKSGPAVIRLAWGATLKQPMADRVAGYRKLQEYLPSLKLDPENSSDFQYQINRPRKSKVVEGLTLNRLQKWGVLAFHSLQFQVGATQAQIQRRLDQVLHACRVELDINTAEDRTEVLPKERVGDLLQELVGLGDEIVTRGDIP
jgi:hypothetical protein